MAKKSKKTIEKPSAQIKAAERERGQIKRTKIKIVGIGGGGGNIVAELSQRLKRANFLVSNTDLAALKQIPRKVDHFLFGQKYTHGLGTGMNPDLAQMAAQDEKENIQKIFQGQDLVILIACLGGGTGSGAAPIFAQLIRNQNLLSYGIFTLPFEFEGKRKMEIAKIALEKIRPKLNALTVIPNESIFRLIDKNTPLKDAFSAINKTLSQGLEGLIETIYQPGLINIDFADLKTILNGQGKWAYLNTVSFSKKEDMLQELTQKALSSPLYPWGLKGAKGVLFNIFGQKDLSLEEINQISKMISEKTHPQAKIIFGLSPLHQSRDILKITIFATGCPAKIFSEEQPLKRKKTRKNIQSKQETIKNTEEKSKLENLPPEIKKKESKELKKSAKSFPGEEKLIARKQNNQHQPDLSKEKSKIILSPQKNKSPKASVENGLVKKIRKNALQLKKEIEAEEKAMLEREKFWEIPAFLRKEKNK